MQLNNQDIEGNGPGKAAPAASPGTPETVEQQLVRERDARALMRDRLRHTEALAAESHALRARMGQELERVTAERDRLRTAAESGAGAGPSSSSAGATAPQAAGSASAPRAPKFGTEPAGPLMTPRAVDWPLRPPEPARRSGPWLALLMLTGLAVGVAGLAWITGTMPGENRMASASLSTPAPPAPGAASTPVVADAAVISALETSRAVAAASAALSPPSGAVALPPLTPEAVLAAAPTAAGRVDTPASPALPGRLRSALDAEGIVAPVDIDSSNGHVDVSDPAADTALRDRTDMIIRAVYAGASLPEPQIEHRWLSPPRAGHVASAALPVAEAPSLAFAAKAPVRAPVGHQAERAKPLALFADAPESRPILPEGRVTAACKESVAARPGARRAAELSACMKHSCCSAANRQTEECRAYDTAYPFTCSAG